MKSGIADAVKRITAPEHRIAEAAVNALQPFASRERYVAYLCKLHAFYAAIEPPLFRWLGDDARRKLRRIEDDLQWCGGGPRSNARETLRPSVRVPAMPTLGHALGVGYVLEGKTLGSRFLLEEARTKLDLDAGHGASFLAGYGPRTGAMWRAYLDTLTSHAAARGGRTTIVLAARATFRAFTSWLGA